MAVPLLRTLSLAFACVVIVAATARGQERSQYVPVTPSLSDRLDRVRGNLFGAGPSRAEKRAPATSQQRPASVGAERNSTPARPSQNAASAPARYGNAGRGYSSTAAMTGRSAQGAARGELDVRPPATNSGGNRNLSPDQIQHDDVPALARRPSFTTMGASAGPDEPSTPESSLRSLQNRLSGATENFNGAGPDDEPNNQVAGPDVASSALLPSSRRTNPFVTGNAPMNSQQVIHPAASAPASPFRSELPSLARSPQPAVAGPVTGAAGAIAPQTTQTKPAVTSSRRGFSGDAPAERIASANPQPQAVTAPQAVGSDSLFKRQSPLISVETIGPRTITIGKEATYNVVVQNSAEVAAQDVTVTIKIPQWADVVATKESTGTAQVPQDPNAVTADGAGAQGVQWTLPRLEARGKEQLTLQIVPRQSRPFDLAVQWTFTPISSYAQVQVQEPKLIMNLSGPSEILFGDTKVYKMTLSNPGTGDAENVSIHLSPLTNPSAPPTKHQIGIIKAGDSKVIEVELTARQSGKVSIRASASADGGLEAQVAEEVTVRRAELVTKIAAGKAKYAGTVASYQIAVANAGNAAADNVQVSATLPSGAKFISANNGGQPSPDGTKVQWTVPSIRAGGDCAIEVKCLVMNPGANRLAVHASAAGEITAAAEEITQVEALADLKLTVVEPKGPIAVGEDVVYEIRVQNRGTKNARDVKIMGYFSGKIEPVAATGEHRLVPGIVIFKPLATLSASGEVVFKITARAKAGGNHMFKAEVVCEAAGAKLGSEHTTLFYGDEAIADDDGPIGAADEGPQSLAPKPVFESAPEEGLDESAETTEPKPQTGSVQPPAPAPGPVYLPVSPFSPRAPVKK